MAINALRFQQQHQETEFTKAGFLVYPGDAYHYHEWEFRTMTKYEATKAEDCWALGAKVVESLRGDAYTVAEDMGTDALKKEDKMRRSGRPNLAQDLSADASGLRGDPPDLAGQAQHRGCRVRCPVPRSEGRRLALHRAHDPAPLHAGQWGLRHRIGGEAGRQSAILRQDLSIDTTWGFRFHRGNRWKRSAGP